MGTEGAREGGISVRCRWRRRTACYGRTRRGDRAASPKSPRQRWRTRARPTPITRTRGRLKSCQYGLDPVAGFVEGFFILATGWPNWGSDEEERSGTQGVNARLAAGRGWRSEWLGRSGGLHPRSGPGVLGRARLPPSRYFARVRGPMSGLRRSVALPAPPAMRHPQPRQTLSPKNLWAANKIEAGRRHPTVQRALPRPRTKKARRYKVRRAAIW